MTVETPRVENIKSVANSNPASPHEIIEALRRALERAYKYPVKSVSIAMHLETGGYETIEEFRDVSLTYPK